MTSHEWRRGNRYGNHIAPKYNAITYTWGRWRLQEDEQPSVRAIDIKGTPWKIPRVDPQRFTARELETVIRKAAEGFSTLSNFREKVLPSVQFVWLDVACIDQRPNSADSAAEIGRQALIFDGAAKVVAWLNTLSSRDLNATLLDLDTVVDQIAQHAQSRNSSNGSQYRTLFRKFHDKLSFLLADPWFSSLWTLQEAYLRYDALLMSREGIIARDPQGRAQPASGVPLHAELFTITGFSEQVASEVVERSNPPADLYDTVSRLLTKSGLQALSQCNALGVYTAAGHRQFSQQQDSIYGIQQIFGARVGRSAAHSDPAKTWTLQDLQMQLGLHLLKKHPVLSQLHVFTAPAPIGSAWLVSSTSSMIPPNQRLASDLATSAAKGHDELAPAEEPQCTFTLNRMEGIVWARFDGLICPFSEFLAATEAFSQHELVEPRLDGASLITISMDVTPEWSSCPEYLPTEYALVPQGSRQKRLASWLAKGFPAGALNILLLGHRNQQGSSGVSIASNKAPELMIIIAALDFVHGTQGC
ncbi:hypothetical protein LQW54_006376 [Pestalotiopsis sp. IQ-011]